MSKAAIVVPTLGNRDASLVPLLRDAGMPHVVVMTEPTESVGKSLPLYSRGVDARGIESLGVTTRPVRGATEPLNIHLWWNRGIDLAVDQGAEVVVIVNDDVRAAPGALAELASYIDPANPYSPVLAWPDNPAHSAVRVTAVTGYCFAIDPARIRPDEAFQWWYGEHDLELRALAQQAVTGRGGTMAVPRLDIDHLRTGYTYDRPVQDLIDADRALFAERYPDLLTRGK
jgi:hypothetical protein